MELVPSSLEVTVDVGTQATQLLGSVRSYNGSKGFGFITGEGPYSDVMFSRHELPEDAREVRGKFLEGRQVDFDAVISPDGRAKATRLAIPNSEGVFLPGLVKSYSEKNGYGFVSSSSIPSEDIRFSKSDFPPLLPGVNLKGALVIFQKQQQADCKLRVIKIQFQTARIAEKFKCLGGVDGSCGYSLGQHSYQPTLGASVLSGIVKSFSEKNGYGFIRIPEQPADIIFGKTDLAGGSVPVGSTVQFMLAMAQDGRIRAKQVMLIPTASFGAASGKGGARSAGESPHASNGIGKRPNGEVALSTGVRMAGTIKSFNSTKGFGFITSPSLTGDVFFMKSNLPLEVDLDSRADMLLVGRAVEYELMQTPDGNMRTQNMVLTVV